VAAVPTENPTLRVRYSTRNASTIEPALFTSVAVERTQTSRGIAPNPRHGLNRSQEALFIAAAGYYE